MTGTRHAFVSLQRPGGDGDDATALHRAIGVVVTSWSVLLPNLPPESLEEIHDGHLLLDLPDGGQQRARIEDVTLLCPADGPAAALVRTADRLPHPTAGGEVRFDRAQLLEALRATDGDLLAALDRLGVPLDALDDRTERALAGLRGHTLPGSGTTRPRIGPSLEEVAIGACDFLPCCMPGDPDGPGGHGGGVADPGWGRPSTR